MDRGHFPVSKPGKLWPLALVHRQVLLIQVLVHGHQTGAGAQAGTAIISQIW